VETGVGSKKKYKIDASENLSIDCKAGGVGNSGKHDNKQGA
jgi:hypothetical protein